MINSPITRLKRYIGIFLLGVSLYIVFHYLFPENITFAAKPSILHQSSETINANIFSPQQTFNTFEYSTGIIENEALSVINLLPWERANSVDFSPDGALLAVGTSLGVRLYDAQTFNEVHLLKTDSWARSVAFSPDGKTIAAGVFDDTIRLWRISDGALIDTFEGHTNWVRDVAFSPDGALLASASDDNTVRLWSVVNGKLLETLNEGTTGVRCVAFSPDGELLAWGSQDGLIRLWQINNGILARTLYGHTDWVRTLVFSNKGEFLASGGFDATARLWRIADGKLIHTLSSHSASVLGLSFSHDDKHIATGSVDTRVGIWRVSDGHLVIMKDEHSNFVYDVAFSPDRELLASSSEDNSVKIWDFTLKEVEDTIHSSPYQEESKKCEECHHPMSNTRPADVIDVRCDACHNAGASFNWCPIFSRSYEIPSKTLVETIVNKGIGVPLGSSAIGLIITSPGNGETIYSHYDFITPIFISGQVITTDNHLGDIDLILEVWQDNLQVSYFTKKTNRDGFFDFYLGVNPNGFDLFKDEPIFLFYCSNCHDHYNFLSYLPRGNIRLKIIARTQDGDQAIDERWISIDISEPAGIEIILTDQLTDDPLSNLNVQAVTRLYEWRSRIAHAITNEEGIATLSLEALSQASTVYQVSVPDQVVEGVFYTVDQATEVVIPSGAISVAPITLKVHGHTGQITGSLIDENGLVIEDIPIWLFNLTDEPVIHKQITTDGQFAFSDIPVSKYILFPNFDVLSTRGLTGEVENIDLTQSPSIELTLHAKPVDGITLKGTSKDAQTDWLPFTWVVGPDGLAQRADPTTGGWSLPGITHGKRTISFNAPGFFSQSLEVEVSVRKPENLELSLIRRPALKSISWENGEILIPPESTASINGQHISLQSGWIWGYGGGSTTQTVTTPEAEIEIIEGKFALERLAQQTSWLYIVEGQASVRPIKSNKTTTVNPGEMAALLSDDELSIAPMQPALLMALHPPGDLPLSPVWQPAIIEQILRILSILGIGTAQVITFITYSAAILSLVIVPITMLFIWKKKLRIKLRE